YGINGLCEKYEQVVAIIHHRHTLPTFAQARSMLLLEETRLARKSNRSSACDSTASSPHVLLNVASNNRNNSTGARLCCNFQRGSCNFGKRCRYLHTNLTSGAALNKNGNNRGSASKWNNTTDRVMHGARVTFSTTRPIKIGYAPGPDVSSPSQPTTNWTSPPTLYHNIATTIGSREILDPAPG
nr:hybrid signal transduction histidine kinase M [Tanacetum cinerariifolium]